MIVGHFQGENWHGEGSNLIGPLLKNEVFLLLFNPYPRIYLHISKGWKNPLPLPSTFQFSKKKIWKNNISMDNIVTQHWLKKKELSKKCGMLLGVLKAEGSLPLIKASRLGKFDHPQQHSIFFPVFQKSHSK